MAFCFFLNVNVATTYVVVYTFVYLARVCRNNAVYIVLGLSFSRIRFKRFARG